jgi:hypothetical protein
MPPERVATFTRGTRVGLFAQQLFPGGIDCGAKSPRAYAKAIEKTTQAIAAGEKIIYEAGFIKHNTLVFLDILVKKDDGWHAFEVKSSTKLSPTYYKDAALQNYVIKESGLDLVSFNLIHINPDYEFKDKLDIYSLFTMVDVTGECNEIYDETGVQIETEIAEAQLGLSGHDDKDETPGADSEPDEQEELGELYLELETELGDDKGAAEMEAEAKVETDGGLDLSDTDEMFETYEGETVEEGTDAEPAELDLALASEKAEPEEMQLGSDIDEKTDDETLIFDFTETEPDEASEMEFSYEMVVEKRPT